ncbi:MAG: CAP domain-containing protein [Hyphomicrobiaceae bacterium]|nr:CAP domain-containing protein [Hyphomicrobiaceae bacterium]
MLRVLLTVLAGSLLAACSSGPSTLSTGFADSGLGAADAGQTSAITRLTPGTGITRSRDQGTPRAAAATKVAALDDRIPAGSYEQAPPGALTGRDYSTTALDAERALALVNQYRADKGLKPLRLNAELTAAAKAHSRDLAKWDRISHYGSDGSNPWDRVKRTGYRPRLTAENVGTGQLNFEEVLRGWKESPGHNKNLLLADARDVGIALVNDDKTEFKTFWTLVLGSSM